jgi:hypothetical protein
MMRDKDKSLAPFRTQKEPDEKMEILRNLQKVYAGKGSKL